MRSIRKTGSWCARMAVAHAEYLAAFPSLHSSDNNHRMAEGLGLFLAGLLVPDLGGAWERDGRRIVEDSARRLILADGGSAEQSPVYLAFVLEMTALVGAPLGRGRDAAGRGRP